MAEITELCYVATPSPLLIATGEAIPLLCLEGVPDLPGAPATLEVPDPGGRAGGQPGPWANRSAQDAGSRMGFLGVQKLGSN